MFFDPRIQTSITSATAEVWAKLLRAVRPLVGGLSFRDISVVCMNPWHEGCQEVFNPSGVGQLPKAHQHNTSKHSHGIHHPTCLRPLRRGPLSCRVEWMRVPARCERHGLRSDRSGGVLSLRWAALVGRPSAAASSVNGYRNLAELVGC